MAGRAGSSRARLLRRSTRRTGHLHHQPLARQPGHVIFRLGRGTGPATLLFEELAGEPIRIDLTGNADRLLTLTECLELNVGPGTYGHQRNGTLRAVNSGLVA